MGMKEQCQKNRFCLNLDPLTRERLCKACLFLQFRPKQEMRFDSSAGQVAIINEGLIISYFLTEEGNKKSLEWLKPGSLLGTDNLYLGNKVQYAYLQALTPAILCLFPKIVFESIFQQSPEFAKAVLQNTTHRLQEVLKHMLHMQSADSEEKVRYILSLLQEEKIDLSGLTHEDIALLTDLNRVTVTRALKTINRQG